MWKFVTDQEFCPSEYDDVSIEDPSPPPTPDDVESDVGGDEDENGEDVEEEINSTSPAEDESYSTFS